MLLELLEISLEVLALLPLPLDLSAEAIGLPTSVAQLPARGQDARLEPGTTKNREGRTVYLTRELRQAFAEQLERIDQVGRRPGRIIPWLFPRLVGRRAGAPRGGFAKAWASACRKAGSGAGCCTTFGGPRSGTSSGPASPAPWR